MIGNGERQRLMRQYPPDAMPSAALAAKCAAGLAIVFGIALFGMQSPPAPREDAARMASAAAAHGAAVRGCDEARPERDAEAGSDCRTAEASGSGGTAPR